MRDARNLSILGLLLACATALLPACGDSGGSGGTAGKGGGTTGNGGTTASGGTSSTAGNGTGGTTGAGAGMTGGNSTGGTGTGGTIPIVEAACENHVYQCGDTIDNDGDGLVDWQDPDCLGPCDNTEDGYYGGIPGQPGPPCTVDCYWDANSGSGDDDCHWTHQCDPNEAMDPGHPEPNSKCPYDANANVPGTGLTCDVLSQTQSMTCGDVCGPLTPNGCDCFGCCELPAGSGKHVWLGSEDEATGQGSCTIADINDPTKCEPCLPVPSCYNPCGICELCVGKDPSSIPDWCNPGSGGGGAGGGGTGGSGMGGSGMGGTGTGGGGQSQCPSGVQACGLPGQPACPVDYYCVTGCCQPIPQPK